MINSLLKSWKIFPWFGYAVHTTALQYMNINHSCTLLQEGESKDLVQNPFSILFFYDTYLLGWSLVPIFTISNYITNCNLTSLINLLCFVLLLQSWEQNSASLGQFVSKFYLKFQIINMNTITRAIHDLESLNIDEDQIQSVVETKSSFKPPPTEKRRMSIHDLSNMLKVGYMHLWIMIFCQCYLKRPKNRMSFFYIHQVFHFVIKLHFV